MRGFWGWLVALACCIALATVDFHYDQKWLGVLGVGLAVWAGGNAIECYREAREARENLRP